MKTRKGGGFTNFFTRKRGLQPRILTNEEEKRKKQLQRKVFKTKQEKEELSILKARLAAPEPQMEEAKTKFQLFLNRFSSKKTLPAPQELLRIPVEGISEVYKNSRKPFSKEKARIPNANIPTPPLIEGEEHRVVNGRQIPLASQIVVEYTNIPLLYAMWRREPPVAKLENIPDAEFEEFVQLIREKQEQKEDGETTNDEIAREIFHAEGGEREMDEWVLQHEQGSGFADGVYHIIDYDVKEPDGSYRRTQLVVESGARDFNRYLARISKGKKAILLARENNDHLCPGDTDPENTSDNYAPLTTLKSNGCFALYNGSKFEEMGSMTNRNGRPLPPGSPPNYDPAMLRKNWMIIDPQYFPLPSAPFLLLLAKYFPVASYIQEALENWAVQGIDALFLELLQMKYPHYAIQFTTYFFNTQDFVYQQKKLKPFDNFLVLDKEIFSQEIGFTALNPFKEPSSFYPMIQRGTQEQKLYGTSPYVAYFMKKMVRPLWLQAFSSSAQTTFFHIYDSLTEQEKITVDFLQYLRWNDAFSASNLNFKVARDTYKEYLSAEIRSKLVRLYILEYPKHKQQLLFYQRLVTKTYKGEVYEEKTKKRDIEAILAKFGETELSSNSLIEPRLNLTALAVSNENFVAPPVVNRPRTVVGSRGAFGNALYRNVSEEKRKLLKRKEELEAYLRKAQETYNSLLPRLRNLEGRAKFLQTKKRYGTLNSSELLNLRKYQTMKNFPVLKQKAEEELNKIVLSLRR